MKVGSLFSGIGGFDIGLERAGYEIAWQVEIDPYCNRVLAKHWPTVPRYGDITAIDWATVPRVDLLCGGFPCQDISIAGKGAGLQGARSGLWSEFVKAIDALKPKYVLIENVAALRSRGLDQVLRKIASLGYDAEWHCIPASAVGAPHRRDRVWVVAYAISANGRRRPVIGNAGDEGRGTGETGRDGIRSQNRQECTDHAESASEDVADARRSEWWQRDTAGCSIFRQDNTNSKREEAAARAGKCSEDVANAFLQQRHRWSDGVGWWEREPQETLQDARRNGRQEDGLSIPESLLGRVAYGVPHRVDRLRGLGNAIVPAIAQTIGEMIMEVERDLREVR